MSEPLDRLSEEDIRKRLSQYSFYHVIEVVPGVFTPGIDRWQYIQAPVTEALRSLPVREKRVLDIGCRDGLFAFEAERLGAAEVVAFDNDLSKGATEFLIPFKQSNVQMHALNLMDLSPSSFGKFDLVIFAGVLYHLRYPFYALKLIRDVMNDGAILIIETALYTLHENEALLHCPVDRESPYEPTSVTFFNLKGLTDTLASFGILVKSHHYLTNHQIPNDRCTLVCEFSARAIDRGLQRYWDSTHVLNSDHEANRDFLASRSG